MVGSTIKRPSAIAIERRSWKPWVISFCVSGTTMYSQTLEGVLETILSTIDCQRLAPPHPNPLPNGERECTEVPRQRHRLKYADRDLPPRAGIVCSALGCHRRAVGRCRQGRGPAAEVSAPHGLCRERLSGQSAARARARRARLALAFGAAGGAGPRLYRDADATPPSTRSRNAAGSASGSRPCWPMDSPRPARQAWRARRGCARCARAPAFAWSDHRASASSICAARRC